MFAAGALFCELEAASSLAPSIGDAEFDDSEKSAAVFAFAASREIASVGEAIGGVAASELDCSTIGADVSAAGAGALLAVSTACGKSREIGTPGAAEALAAVGCSAIESTAAVDAGRLLDEYSAAVGEGAEAADALTTAESAGFRSLAAECSLIACGTAASAASATAASQFDGGWAGGSDAAALRSSDPGAKSCECEGSGSEADTAEAEEVAGMADSATSDTDASSAGASDDSTTAADAESSASVDSEIAAVVLSSVGSPADSTTASSGSTSAASSSTCETASSSGNGCGCSGSCSCCRAASCGSSSQSSKSPADG